ncbi:MAG: carboxynorspermidine decarboxylase [Methylococcales bacterium]|nr:carboxynorspermidine decarboxylase [Methylococcales bacterium]
MDLNELKNKVRETPAFVFDEKGIDANLSQLVNLKKKSGCQVLYSIKALPLERVLKKAAEYLDGLSVSSLFEARLAKEVMGETGSIHLTTPGIRDDEFNELIELCTHISFNSINQYQRLIPSAITEESFGFRINPKLSFSEDSRFDPCRQYSKLGIEIEALDCIPKKIQGVHFHTVFAHQDFLPLEKIVVLLKRKFGHKLIELKWMNFGGGYLYNQILDQEPFTNLVRQLKTEFNINVYIEPGKAVVGNAGYLVSTVIDSFSSDGKSVMVLDTSVNHNPEVFEYQRKPNLLEEDKKGAYSYLLVGSSCLAGDLFGEYRFTTELKIGDRVVFVNVGAYSLIKANRFNGYNLPDIYWADKTNRVTLIKHNTYENYHQQWVE